jgi:acyl-coenzyme A synthetase/AMP-(fatty) acid ligase
MARTTDGGEARASFKIDVPEEFNFTRDVIDDWAKREPDRLALIAVQSDGRTVLQYTFGELAALANRAAHVLRMQGVAQGDHIFVQLPRVIDWYSALLGAFKIGAVPMPGTTQLMSKDQAYRINRAGASVAIVEDEGAERLDRVRGDCPSLKSLFVAGSSRDGWTDWRAALSQAPAEPAEAARTMADDPLLLYFTSGTTGQPKMVQHAQSYALGHEITARFWQDLGRDDIHWTVSDTGWAKAAWGKLFGQWIVGCTVVMWNIVGKPDMARMLELIGELRVTSFCAPPTIYRAFTQLDLSAYDWSSLRHCTAAGEPLNPEVIEVWRQATGTTPYDGYGQTESVCLVTNHLSEPVKPGSMGRPAPGMRVAIVDDDGRVLDDYEEGHIAVHTDPWPIGLFRGYWQDEQLTAEVFRNGWYYTGDRGRRDEDGYIWFIGRADDVILSAAYRIGPFEVESALIEHPSVAEAAVVGKPDRARGQIVKAFIILAPGFQGSEELTAEIQAHVKSVTAPYKYPREIEYVRELPKTISGKIRRVELRGAG